MNTPKDIEGLIERLLKARALPSYYGNSAIYEEAATALRTLQEGRDRYREALERIKAKDCTGYGRSVLGRVARQALEQSK